MAEDFGLTFSPTTSLNKDRNAANADANGPVQEAIRTLSLRIPKVTGGKGLAPQPLLNSMGSQGLGTPGGMNLEMLLKMLFGQGGGMNPQGMGQTQPMPGGSMGAPAPMPNFSPGVGGSAPTPQFTPGSEAPNEDHLKNLPAPGSWQDNMTPKPDLPRLSDPFGGF